MIAIHDEAAKSGQTWDFGIRDAGAVHSLAAELRKMASERLPPHEIAGRILHLTVHRHAFWDANHRTGFELAQMTLRAFGQKILVTTEEAERFVRSIDEHGLPPEAVAEWTKRHIGRAR